MGVEVRCGTGLRRRCRTPTDEEVRNRVARLVTLIAPVLAALGALAALLTRVKVEIVRTRGDERDEEGS